MAYDIDEPLVALLRTRVAMRQPTDRNVDGLLVLLVDQGVGRLLYMVVLETISRICLVRRSRIAIHNRRVADELVVLLQRNDHVLLQRWQQSLAGLIHRAFMYDGQGPQIERIADACSQLQDALGRRRKSTQAGHHEFDDVAGEPAAPDRFHVPTPAAPLRRKGNRPRPLKRLERLSEEERIPQRPLIQQLAQRLAGGNVGMQGVRPPLLDGRKGPPVAREARERTALP